MSLYFVYNKHSGTCDFENEYYLSKSCSENPSSFNIKRLAELSELISISVADDVFDSDQDEMMGELKDIGFFVSRKSYQIGNSERQLGRRKTLTNTVMKAVSEDTDCFTMVQLSQSNNDISRELLQIGIPTPKRPISAGINELMEEKRRQNSNRMKANVTENLFDSSWEKQIIKATNETATEQARNLRAFNGEFEDYVKCSLSAHDKRDTHTLRNKRHMFRRRRSGQRNDSICTWPDGCRNAGVIEMKIQYLIITERLKVTLIRAKNLLHPVSHSGSPSIFTQLCLVPGKIQKKKSEYVAMSNNPEFKGEIFYFKGIILEDMHKMTLRVRVKQERHRLKRSQCLGQVYITLDDKDLVGETCLAEQLQ